MRPMRFVLGLCIAMQMMSAFGISQQTGAIDVMARAVKIDGKSGIISRKRFYLFSGGLTANRSMLDRIKAADIRSRDCYYGEKQASPQFICWLKAENCESPYCRTLTDADIQQVPEFKAAYTKGLTQFKGLPEIARGWITTNLPTIFTSGYYEESKSLATRLLGTAVPIKSTMTDVKGVKTTFTDIPLTFAGGKTTQTYLVSNVLPFEYSGKSYVWACEVEVGAEKTVSLVLQLPSTRKTCEVYVRDLQACKTEACPTK
jgi:hypothetical protein